MHLAFIENMSEIGAIAPKISKKSLFGQKRAVEYVDVNRLTNDCTETAQKAENPERNG